MKNSPKIYFLKNKEGKFYNTIQKTYYTSIVNANYDRSPKQIEGLIELKFHDHEIHTITEYEFMEEMALITTNAVVAGEYFSRLLFDIACVLPTVSQVNKTMYQKCKSAIEVLKPFSKMHTDFVSKEENKTDEVSGYYTEFITEISKIQIHKTHEITAILQAYQKDRSSILGIIKKILK